MLFLGSNEFPSAVKSNMKFNNIKIHLNQITYQWASTD